MPKTLFRYIFWDLLKIFLLANGALAGVMSFGGLLRPLTKEGLELGEVLQMVGYLMPAMSTYSLPVAALFATTLVYGRLAAENELTAMRAGGISHLQAAYPGIFLGIFVAGASLAMLFFVVPASTFQVQRIVTANTARLLTNSIERTHEFDMTRSGGPVLSAQAARIGAPDVNDPTLQTVILDSPLIISSEIETRPDAPAGRLRIPRDFYTAEKATVRIRPVAGTDEVEVSVQLDRGVTFPRKFQNTVTGGIEATQFGPERIPSVLAEKTKFMDLARLQSLRTNPDASKRVQTEVSRINVRRQQQEFFLALEARFKESGLATLPGVGGEQHTVQTPPGVLIEIRRDSISLTTPKDAPPSFRPIRFETSRAGSAPLVFEARDLTIRPRPDNVRKVTDFDFTFERGTFRTGNDEPTAFERRRRAITVPMTPEVAALGTRSVTQLNLAANTPTNELARTLIIIRNEVIGEINSRLAFAISCLTLVLLGVALGMMFRAGHYLTAFAISVVPALASILLTVTGQHVLENIPRNVGPHWSNPLTFGVVLIWTGNLVVAAIASALLIRLQRQ